MLRTALSWLSSFGQIDSLVALCLRFSFNDNKTMPLQLCLRQMNVLFTTIVNGNRPV